MEFYHVLNRGVEKRDVVLNDDDRMRFVRSLYLFNDKNPAPNAISQPRSHDYMTRDCLVRIHAWCLMNNHYHLLLSPVDNDLAKLSLFIKKLNGGYAKFFNEKYERSGYLWQGKTKKIKIERDDQFLYIPYYIHLNPLDFKLSEWRNGGVQDVEEAIKYLNEYRWSSWLDYMEIKNFPSLLDNKILSEILESKQTQVDQIIKIIQNQSIARNSEHLEH